MMNVLLTQKQNVHHIQQIIVNDKQLQQKNMPLIVKQRLQKKHSMEHILGFKKKGHVLINHLIILV